VAFIENRLIWPSLVLQSQGHDIAIMAPSKTSGFRAATQLNANGQEVLTSVEIPQDADAVVVQRPAHPLQPQMINILRSNGVAVIVDMDDDMSCIHPENSAFHMYRHHSPSAFSWRHAALSCKIASLVTVSTTQLAKVYGAHGRVRVLDNYVPGEVVGIPHMPTGAFGWAGTTKSHPNDPQVTAPTSQKLVSEGYTFQVVGGDSRVKDAFRMRNTPLMTGSVEFADWIPTLASAMDVGWAPLAATSFNTSKSRLKALEYMAAGIAWIGSPRAEYRRVAKESGCGLLADTPKQWYNLTKELMDNESLRQEQVAAGYEYMKTQTYEANAWRWAEAWTEAVVAERKRVGLEPA
jgi:hypothetical protein